MPVHHDEYPAKGIADPRTGHGVFAMSDNIVLSRGIRTNLLLLQGHSRNLEISQERLATGKRVNSVLDNPLNYFQADGLRQRGRDLSNLLDQMSISIETLKVTGKAIEAIQKLAESAIGILRNAAATSDNATRNAARQSFEEIKNQINQLAQDASYNGRNLLNGGVAGAYNTQFDLRVSFNESLTTQLDVKAVNLRATGTGATGATDPPLQTFVPRTAVTAYDSGAAGDAALQADLAALSAFNSGLRAAASNFGINLTILQNRQDFTKGAILTLNVGSDALTIADQNEEGAKLLALQTRQQLSTQALSLANQADQAVLRLFG
jgi:flagellin-like hook-associated protein FlgL